MDSARYQQIQTLFQQAAELSPAYQNAFLKAECDDQDLIAEVRAMLDEDAGSASLLDRDVAEVANEVFGKPIASPDGLKEIGSYKVKRLLGEGGMGVVYLAERSDLGNSVAIKILRDAWLSPSRRNSFAREQRLLAQLNHPAIARLYDANAFPDGTPFFVMEYVEGSFVTDYCRKMELSVRARLQLFRSICEAVLYAHQNAVIHCDLKPSNILVKEDGTVRLLDFGIAKQSDSMETSVDQTRTLLRFMTSAYASPERIRGERVGVQVDVYSLGVVLYEMLTGRLPFDLRNCTTEEVRRIVLEQEPEPPSAAAKQTGAESSHDRTSWKDLDALCLTALHKDLQKRYQSVEALMRDIDHYLHGKPLEARPDTFGYRVGKFVRRHYRSVTAAALAIATVVSLTVFFTVRLNKARNIALTEAARTQRTQRFMMNLFEGGDESAGPANDLRVITLIERGEQEAKALNNEPEIQAELYKTLGTLYQKLDKLDQADTLLQTALTQRRSLFGSEHPDIAETLIAIGRLRVDQGQLEQAEELVRQGLEMDRRILPPGDVRIATALGALGTVLEERGQYDKAIPVFEESIRLHSASSSESAELAESIIELANTHYYAGHYDTCESLSQRALEIHRRLYGDRHPKVADDIINLGAVQQERGKYVEAERLYRQGYEIIENWYGKDHHRTASALTMVVRAIQYQGRLTEAESYFQEILAVQERVYGKNHVKVASILNEMGSVNLQLKKLEEAKADFRRAAEIYREVHKDKHYLIGITLSNLASVYLEEKDYTRAESLFREVLRRYSETLAPDHLYTGIARIKLGRTLLREQRYTEAEGYTLSGYEILKKQTSPTVSWLRSARTDLATLYDALHQPEKAESYRAELANLEAKK
jgi:serine/threonine-protein kinase